MLCKRFSQIYVNKHWDGGLHWFYSCCFKMLEWSWWWRHNFDGLILMGWHFRMSYHWDVEALPVWTWPMIMTWWQYICALTWYDKDLIWFWFQDVLLPVHHRGVQVLPSRAEPNPPLLFRPAHRSSTWHKWDFHTAPCTVSFQLTQVSFPVWKITQKNRLLLRAKSWNADWSVLTTKSCLSFEKTKQSFL